MNPRRLSHFAAAMLFLASGCQFLFPPANSPTPQVALETVIANAQTPVDLAFAPDGTLYYTELATGRISVFKNGALLAAPFAGVPVNSFGERGLLGIALHPGFPARPFVYVFYTRSNTGANSAGQAEALDNRIVRFTADGDVALAGSEQLLVTFPIGTPGIHNGGIIRFGADGQLYVSLGDLGESTAAQDAANPRGKIHRYTDSGGIPADNSIPGNSIFALGLRNVFGLGFDASGRLFANENGPANHDEVNIIVAGANYGWPNVHGAADDAAGDPAGEVAFANANANYRNPIFDKADGSDGAAGIDVNRGTVYGASAVGDVFFGQFGTARVMRLVLDPTGASASQTSVFAEGFSGGINGLKFAPDGTLWVATTNSIVKLVPTAPIPVAP